MIGSAVPSGARAQACSAGVVREVVFDRGKPFGLDMAGPEARFGWVFRTMNAVHIRTREKTLRWELLFRENDCLDLERLQESERSLRDLPFIVDAEVRAEPHPQGGHRVTVLTRDGWAASAGASVSFDDGITLTGLSASAKNAFGTGTRGSLFRTSYRERKRTGLLARQPNLLGTRVDFTVAGGKTQPGDFRLLTALRPFAGEVGRTAFRQSFSTRGDYFGYSTAADFEPTQAYLRFEASRFELHAQRRFGDSGGPRLVLGIGVSRERLDVPAEGSSALSVFEQDFDAPVSASPLVAGVLARHANSFERDRVHLSAGLRAIRFESRTRLDALSATQDVPIGFEATVAIAPSIREPVDPTPDVWSRVRTLAGLPVGDRVYLHGSADIEGVRDRADSGGWHDVLFEGRLIGYWSQSSWSTLFVRSEASGAHSETRPFQTTLGGREGVRGYDEDAFPGTRRWVTTVEQRASIPGWTPGIADVGFSAFVDVGRMRPGDVPFGVESGWRASVGAGLRLGMPRGSQDVLRIDATVPVGASGGSGTVVRIYTEVLGLLDRRGWPSQMDRSRWSGFDPDLTRRPRDPLAGS